MIHFQKTDYVCWGYAIHNRMIVWEEFNTALIYLTKADLKKYNFQVGDTEGIVNYPLDHGKDQSIHSPDRKRKNDQDVLPIQRKIFGE